MGFIKNLLAGKAIITVRGKMEYAVLKSNGRISNICSAAGDDQHLDPDDHFKPVTCIGDIIDREGSRALAMFEVAEYFNKLANSYRVNGIDYSMTLMMKNGSDMQVISEVAMVDAKFLNTIMQSDGYVLVMRAEAGCREFLDIFDGFYPDEVTHAQGEMSLCYSVYDIKDVPVFGANYAEETAD